MPSPRTKLDQKEFKKSYPKIPANKKHKTKKETAMTMGCWKITLTLSKKLLGFLKSSIKKNSRANSTAIRKKIILPTTNG